MTYTIRDQYGDSLGQVPNLEDSPEWDGLLRSPKAIARDNDGYIEETASGRIVYEAP